MVVIDRRGHWRVIDRIRDACRSNEAILYWYVGEDQLRQDKEMPPLRMQAGKRVGLRQLETTVNRSDVRDRREKRDGSSQLTLLIA